MPKRFYHRFLRFSARHWTTIFKENEIFYDCDSQEDDLKQIGRIDKIEKVEFFMFFTAVDINCALL